VGETEGEMRKRGRDASVCRLCKAAYGDWPNRAGDSAFDEVEMALVEARGAEGDTMARSGDGSGL